MFGPMSSDSERHKIELGSFLIDCIIQTCCVLWCTFCNQKYKLGFLLRLNRFNCKNLVQKLVSPLLYKHWTTVARAA